MNGFPKVTLPDFSACTVNLINSIGAFFGLESYHPGLPVLDKAFNKKYRGVMLLVLDGLGSAILEEHLPESSFLRSHKLCDLNAVFPPTTVAAVPTLRSGLFPGEHGWLGWTMYFPQLDQNVDVFTNRTQFTKEAAYTQNAATHFLPYPQLTQRINEQGLAKAYAVSAHDEVYADSFQAIMDQSLQLCRGEGRVLIHAYFHHPDAAMHNYGVHSEEALMTVKTLDLQVKKFSESLPRDTLLLVTADHGLVDASPLAFEDHPELNSMLSRAISMEPRAAAIFVRPEYQSVFPEAFKAAFGQEFWLLSREDFLATGLLGPMPYREGIGDYLGDFIAIATGDKALFMKKEHCKIIGMHAGITEAERRVPLITL